MIRRYREEDYSQLEHMLFLEGLQASEMEFSKFTTWVMAKGKEVMGFFTYEKDDTAPHLFHFCIRRAYRSQRTFYRLANAFKRKMKDVKAQAYIVSAPCRNIRLVRFIKSYLRTKPYSLADGNYFFVKGVK